MPPKTRARVVGRSAQYARTRDAPYISLIHPMIGPAIAVEKLPLAPMIASSSAPPRGNRSDVIPSIVGHQNAIAAANTAAAAKAAAGVLARLQRYSPAAAGSAVTPINATGAITCAARAPN